MKTNRSLPQRVAPVLLALALLVIAVGAVVTVPPGSVTLPVPGDRVPPYYPPPIPVRVQNNLGEGITHFPLHAGSEWVYEKRDAFGTESTWRVTLSEPEAGAEAGFELRGYFGERHVVKHDSDGAVTELSADGNSSVWYRLGTSVGSTWTLECGEGCVGCLDHASARLASHSELVRVPAGEFPDALRVDYTCDCMDAGLVSEWFAEGVGLIKRLEQSIAGPIESVLLRANVGGIVLPDHPAATSLTLDETRISIAGSAGKPRITGAFRVHDQTSDSLTFEFEGCVSAALVLIDEAGQVVLEGRADDGGCCDCQKPVKLELHGETLVLPFVLVLLDREERPVPAGHYSLVATLRTLDAPPTRPAATVHVFVE